jgi:hypothetical protein
MKTSHFKNSVVSMENFEPLYKHLFEVIITPPTILENSVNWLSNSGQALVLEQVTKISGINVDIHPGMVDQKYKGAKRNFSGVIPANTSVEFTISFNLNLNDANQNFVYNSFREWSDLIYDPLTATQTLKKDYVSPAGCSITQFNKIGDVYRKIDIRNLILSKEFGALDFAYGENNIMDMNITFTGDYFDNTFK